MYNDTNQSHHLKKISSKIVYRGNLLGYDNRIKFRFRATEKRNIENKKG